MASDSPRPALEDFVERTTGVQPWRKVFHALNGSAIAAALLLVEPSRGTAVAILSGALLVLLGLDVLRLLRPDANELFFRTFTALASPREAVGIASSTWYALGVLLSVALFPRPNAISGILVLGLADPAASYFGQTVGRRPFMGGTAVGSLVFLAVGAVTLGLRHGWVTGVLAAIATTLAERRSWPLDDNLTIPVACAAAVTGLGML